MGGVHFDEAVESNDIVILPHDGDLAAMPAYLERYGVDRVGSADLPGLLAVDGEAWIVTARPQTVARELRTKGMFAHVVVRHYHALLCVSAVPARPRNE